MQTNNLIAIISVSIAIWGILVAIFFIFNSSLKRVLNETNNLIKDLDLNNIKPKNLSPTYLTIKRVMDFCFSFLALVILFPLFVFVAILIKIDSDGPIILYQTHIGLKGKKFKYYKFRTLCSTTPENTFLTFMDSRITRVGLFLRKTALDEIPAFFNVIKGDISIVGRSRILDYQTSAKEINPEIKNILLDIKPGVISLWSVSYDRVNSNIDSLLAYDLLYRKKMSILFDLKITIRSIVVVLGSSAGL